MNNLAAFLLALFVFSGSLLGCTPPQRTVVADELDCLERDDTGENCIKWSNLGTWSIAVNAGASTCSIMLEIRRTKEQRHERTQSLSYVNEDNWECRAMPNKNNFQLVARMSHGNLAMDRIDADSSAASEHFKLEHRGLLDDIKAALKIGADK